MADPLHISLAGRVALHRHGTEETEVPLGNRARVALAYLVTERARPVSASVLADAVWGTELPPTWRAALRGVIARIRSQLAAAGLDAGQTLISGPGGYQLRLPPEVTVDVEVAQAALRAAQDGLAHHPSLSCAEARRAVDLLGGEFVAGAEGVWVERRQAEFAELHLRSLETLSDAACASGDVDSAIWSAEKAVALEPLRESAHVRAMAAHEAAGNRAGALRAYERCRRLLADELGVAPSSETDAAYLKLLGHEAASGSQPALEPVPSNLPAAVKPFIGREEEKARIGDLLVSSRLLTLTGPGGVGKSRLAVEVARTLAARLPDGVFLVELAGIPVSRPLPEHVLSALALPEQPGRPAGESLVAHVRDKRVLLILDNCEHLLPASAALVDQVLRSSPGVAFLTTSREPLGVDGEAVWVVEPLSSADSVALFLDRAQAAAPTVRLGSSHDVVATICRRLDGLPLAIELAAARMRTMGLEDIARRLDDRFPLLSDGPRTCPVRHQTLRATLDWSYEALAEDERRLFESLAVFAGDFSAGAVAALDDEDVNATADRLGHLVDKSLVVSHCGPRQSRYRLLETTRQYAREKLAEGTRESVVARAHLRWATDIAEAAEGGLEGPAQLASLELLDAELENLRGVLDWAVEHAEESDGARLAASLWRYWEVRGLLSEGRTRLEAALGGDPPAPLRAKILNASAVLAQGQGDTRAARERYGEALLVRRGLGDLRGASASLNGLGNTAVAEGDLASAQAIFEENLATSRQLGDERLIAASLMNLGVVIHLLFANGRLDESEGAVRSHALYTESLALYRRLDDRRAVAQALENLGAVAPYLGDEAGAYAYLEESLALRRELDDRSGIAASARFLGHLALKCHEYGAARSLHEECLAIERDLGNELLVVADLASLAEIAAGENKPADARRLVEQALQRARHIGDVEWAVNLRRRLAALRT